MKQICIISGKGGTGKSSIAAAFATLTEQPIVLADCDVDAANQSLFFESEDSAKNCVDEPFFAGTKAQIEKEACTQCGKCLQVCRYNAIQNEGATYHVHNLNCEGCHACAIVCTADAIVFEENQVGRVFVRNTSFGSLVHAALGVAQDNSGKLVADVRNRAIEVATQKKNETILIDGPPGIGCPVHASLTGVDAALIVTEPSVAGVHDMERILKLCSHFKIPTGVIINKYDLSEERCFDIEQYCQNHQTQLIGKIPFDRNIPLAQCKGKTPTHLKMHRDNLKHIWNTAIAQ